MGIRPQHVWLAAALVLVIAIGAVDLLTGPEITVSVFYVLPVLAASWFVGRTPGVFVAIASALSTLTADLLLPGVAVDFYSGFEGYAHPLIPWWNALARMGLYSIVAVVTAGRRAEQGKLERALQEIRTLRGLLPICAWCKQIRDDQGEWMPVETYVAAHSDAKFTHGICEPCAARVSSDS